MGVQTRLYRVVLVLRNILNKWSHVTLGANRIYYASFILERGQVKVLV